MGPELIISLGATWAVSWALLWRLRARLQEAHPEQPVSEVSLIIPARNEAENLPRLLASIAAQDTQPCEVIVVDDGSTDGTAEIAVAHGTTVIRAAPPPVGWVGKSWACETGAREARGGILMFLDADAWFEPDGLRRILVNDRGGAFSILPWHRTRTWKESLSAVFNLLMAVGTVPDGLSGPCLLVGREDYRKAGGHEAVKSDILETVHLSGYFRRAGVPVASVIGKGVLAFRMYPGSIGAIARGWMKGFADGAAKTPPWVVLLISVWMGGLIGSVVACFLSPWGWIAWAAFAVQFAVMLSRVGRFNPLAAFCYPIPVAFYLVVFVASAIGFGKRLRWKGRELHGR